MRSFLTVLLSSLHQLALSVWLGGAFVLGAVAAPAPFKIAKQQGQDRWGMPLYDFAGHSTGLMFERFNGVVLVCAVLLLISGLAYGSLAGLCPTRLKVRAALTLAATAGALWTTFVLFPQMIALREEARMGDFDLLHRSYSAAFQGQLLLLFGVLLLTGWMHLLQPGRGDRGEERGTGGERLTGGIPQRAGEL
jgi:hypothetical protein